MWLGQKKLVINHCPVSLQPAVWRATLITQCSRLLYPGTAARQLNLSSLINPAILSRHQHCSSLPRDRTGWVCSAAPPRTSLQSVSRYGPGNDATMMLWPRLTSGVFQQSPPVCPVHIRCLSTVTSTRCTLLLCSAGRGGSAPVWPRLLGNNL